MSLIVRMSCIALALAFAVHVPNAFAGQATYYRFWQGFRKPGLTAAQFRGLLPPFMRGISVYDGRGINQYLVAVPPENRPSFLPDEFALIAMESEASYRAVRSTPPGIAYGDSHWALFDQARSQSAPMRSGSELVAGAAIEWNVAYDMLGAPVDLQSGYTAFFIGLRNPGVSVDAFRAQLKEHVTSVAATLGPIGLAGYLILATENYEVAYMHWTSEAAATAAFAGPLGQTAAAQAGALMTPAFFDGSKAFDGREALAGAFYRSY